MTVTQTISETMNPAISPGHVWGDSQADMRSRRNYAESIGGLGFFVYVETDGRPEADVLADVVRWAAPNLHGGPVARTEDDGAQLAVYLIWGFELERYDFPHELDPGDRDGSSFELWHERQVLKSYKRAEAAGGMPELVDIVSDW